jgi:hypothetical protein
VLQNFRVKTCQFLVRNGHLVRRSFVLKKQDSFRKLASPFGDQLLLQFVEKCNVVLCPDGCTLSQLVYKRNFIFVQEDRRQYLAWWLLYLELLWTRGITAPPFLAFFVGLWIIYTIYIYIYIDPSFIHEASTPSRFWPSLRRLGTHLAESFLVYINSLNNIAYSFLGYRQGVWYLSSGYASIVQPPLWSSGQSYCLQNGDVLCFLWGTNWIYICYVEERGSKMEAWYPDWLTVGRKTNSNSNS